VDDEFTEMSRQYATAKAEQPAVPEEPENG
jgi:hypothetical protein